MAKSITRLAWIGVVPICAIALVEAYSQTTEFLGRPRVLAERGAFDITQLRGLPPLIEAPAATVCGMVGRPSGLYFSVKHTGGPDLPPGIFVLHADLVGNVIKTVPMPSGIVQKASRSIDVDSSGNLYVFEQVGEADRPTTRLVVFDPEGKRIQTTPVRFRPESFCLAGEDVVLVSN